MVYVCQHMPTYFLLLFDMCMYTTFQNRPESDIISWRLSITNKMSDDFIGIFHGAYRRHVPFWDGLGYGNLYIESTSGQVMACCLTTPSHSLKQCWLLNREVLLHSPESNFAWNVEATYLFYEFLNYTFKLLLLLPGRYWDKHDYAIKTTPEIRYVFSCGMWM